VSDGWEQAKPTPEGQPPDRNGAGLLRAIFEDPEDDTVRLVYADFLDEKGDPRGEFIRLQVLRHQEKEPRAPCPREQELLERHFAEWTREAQPFDPETVRLAFERGFIANANIEHGCDKDLEVLRRLPGLRGVGLEACEVSPEGLRDVAALRHLDAFSVYDETRITEAGLKILEGLPCWTRVYCDGGFPDEVAWADFQERRIAKFDQLPPEERQRAARRFLSALMGTRGPITEIRLTQQPLNDAEMRFFREIAELEHLTLFDPYGLTSGGFRHLAGMPNLKSFRVFKAAVDTIRPLMECPSLEVLQADGSPWGAVLRDEGTEGLDKLTNLRVLHLDSQGLGDATITRLRPLGRLRELTLEIGPLADENCLETISGLTALEELSINQYGGQYGRPGGLSDGMLRHLAPLKKLRSLKLHLAAGSGEGLRSLAGLTELRFLQLSGPAVTDASIAHLTTLTELRTLFAQPSSITESGGRALAERLPAVTIITMEHVIKSPRTSVSFRRRLFQEWASVMFPEGWSEHWGPGSATEDGWKDIGSWSGGVVGPAQIRFYPSESQSPTPAEDKLRQHLSCNSHLNPRRQERDLIDWPGWETASCVYENDHGRHLVCVGVREGRVVSLDCEAPVARFEFFRLLFLFVARSVRLGDAAKEGVDERISVPGGGFEAYVR
jgi:uncharacterized protein (TIGR02996 family)